MHFLYQQNSAHNMQRYNEPEAPLKEPHCIDHDNLTLHLAAIKEQIIDGFRSDMTHDQVFDYFNRALETLAYDAPIEEAHAQALSEELKRTVGIKCACGEAICYAISESKLTLVEELLNTNKYNLSKLEHFFEVATKSNFSACAALIKVNGVNREVFNCLSSEDLTDCFRTAVELFNELTCDLNDEFGVSPVGMFLSSLEYKWKPLLKSVVTNYYGKPDDTSKIIINEVARKCGKRFNHA